MSVDWGTVPAWFGAVFTPASVLIAYRSLRRTEQRGVRDQASRVHVTASRSSRALTGRIFAVELRVVNLSDAPVYSVTLDLPTVTQASGPDSAVLAARPFLDVGANLTATRNFDENAASDHPDAFAEGVAQFRDANGVWWERFSSGELNARHRRPAVLARVRQTVSPDLHRRKAKPVSGSGNGPASD